MRIRKGKLSMGLVGLIISFMTGCVTPPAPNEMVPTLTRNSLPSSGVILRIEQVTGGEKTRWWDMPTIENEGFEEAMIKTLESSGMFQKVAIGFEGGDYSLGAQIISQRVSGQWTKFLVLLVRYRLVNLRNGTEIWAENLLSQSKRTGKDSFVGFEALREIQVRVVRDNLTQLTNKLDTVLHSNPT